MSFNRRLSCLYQRIVLHSSGIRSQELPPSTGATSKTTLARCLLAGTSPYHQRCLPSTHGLFLSFSTLLLSFLSAEPLLVFFTHHHYALAIIHSSVSITFWLEHL